MAFRTSNILLFMGGAEMGGAEEVLGVVEGQDILYQWSKPFSICSAPSLTYSTMKASPFMQEDFVLELRMNAFFVCPVKTIGTDSFLFGQPVCQSSKLPMECSELIQGMDFMLAFLVYKFSQVHQ